MPTSTASGGNKQKQQNIVVEVVKGENNEVEAGNVKAKGFVGRNVDFRDPLPNVKVAGEKNKLTVKGDIQATGVSYNMD